MTAFTPEHLEAVVAACRENLAAVAESLNQCFDTTYRVELGPEGAWNPEADSSAFAGPGLMVTIGVGDEGLTILIPATLPLPDWYTKPGDSENARLQTLPMEWSMNLLPADLEAGRSASVDVANLWESLKEAAPGEAARMAELLLFSADGAAAAPAAPEAPAAEAAETKADAPAEPAAEKSKEKEEPVAETSKETVTETEPKAGAEKTDEGAATTETAAATEGPAPLARLLMVWPVTKPLFEKPAGSDSAADGEGNQAEASNEDTGAGEPSPINEFRQRARRIMNLPVIVSVRLAEKRIEMGQLLNITPGSLITFNKSCEEMLDLYVNNRKYCRGEAVKIGEKFGIKVNQVGVVEVREERVL